MAKQRVNILSQSAIDALRRDHERLRLQVQMLEQRVRALAQVVGGVDDALKIVCRFRLDAALATTDSQQDATIHEQFGEGRDHKETSIIVNNLPSNATSAFTFEGDTDDYGMAIYAGAGNVWHIIQMECP